MIAQVFVLLACVAGALAVICCTPPQWEGNEGFRGEYASFFRRPRIVEEAFKQSYDSENQKIAASGKAYLKQSDKEKTSFKVIFRYDQRQGYFINFDTKKCFKFELKYLFEKLCIPDSAKSLGSTYYGAGDAAFKVNAYSIKFKRERQIDVEVVVTVTAQGCIPVNEANFGTVEKKKTFFSIKDYFYETIAFTGITPGIASQDIFEPPSFCDFNSTALEKEYINEDFEHKFKIFHF